MQIFIFITCALSGIISGVAYDVLYIVRCILCGPYTAAYTVKDRIFLVACDFLYCVIFAALYIFMSVLFNFGDLRLYMLLGCAAGAFIYLKSLHLIVAFFVKKVYNKINKRKEHGSVGRKA